MFKKATGVLSAAVSVLGIAGIVMGLGYTQNVRDRAAYGSDAEFGSMLERDSKIGAASILAGVGVAVMGPMLYLVLGHFNKKFDKILAE